MPSAIRSRPSGIAPGSFALSRIAEAEVVTRARRACLYQKRSRRRKAHIATAMAVPSAEDDDDDASAHAIVSTERIKPNNASHREFHWKVGA